ncbi:MAG: hypothetical protein ABI833_14355 [Acidobacteriota bacterium]
MTEPLKPANVKVTPDGVVKLLLRFDVDLGPDVSLGSGLGVAAILSPDGTRMAYVSQGKLFTRKLDQPKATELAGTEGAFSPFFSPDGKWIAFFTVSNLKKLSVDGVAPVILGATPNAFSGSWGEDGNIIASLNNLGGLSRIPSGGGAPTPVTELAPGELTHLWPQVLPGGKAVLFTSRSSHGDNIEVVSLKDHHRKTLYRGGTFGRYLATSKGTGHLVYMNNGTLFAMGFSLNSLEVRGAPVPVLEQVANFGAGRYAQIDFAGAPSVPGMLMYRSSAAEVTGQVTVRWLDSQGKTQPLLAKPGDYARLRFSPDGQRLAMEIPEGSSRDIWIYERERDTATRLTFDAGRDSMGSVWTLRRRRVCTRAFWTMLDHWNAHHRAL